ncbi:hypothetical protein J2739_003429 [Variovorax soli]|uniref:Uncharacterized protein n=1 Tax=Variovorax soli TaxID=376815 RepID=A0ABU1NGR5_9BURK|nr:hypothetical protein [Variovorax soli]
MNVTPRLRHFVWSANPSGGHASGPAQPVAPCSPTGARIVMRSESCNER